MRKFKGAFLVMVAVGMAIPSHAKTQKQTQIETTLRQIMQLIEAGEQMNIEAAAKTFDEPNLKDMALFTQIPSSPALMYYYAFERPDTPLKSVRYYTALDGSRGYGVVNSSVEFEFKDKFCPEVADYEKATGNKALATQVPNPPDVITGHGSSYTMHFIDIKEDKSLMMVGCRVSVHGHVKLS